ncbi:MAG: YciI family protein [Dehalococcoidia bacterium]
MLLIYDNEKAWETRSESEGEELMRGYYAFTEEVRGSGRHQGGAPLQSAATATTVRVRDGATSITDGPFAETKEQLGGYYIVDCNDIDEAIEIAARIPGAKYGSIEVRPIAELPG